MVASERRSSVMSWCVVTPTAVGHRLNGDGKMAAVAELGGVGTDRFAARQTRKDGLDKRTEVLRLGEA